jgi:hypothetical protein
VKDFKYFIVNMSSMTYYLRKMVKFPHKVWKYKYLERETFFEIPANIWKDQRVIGFVSRWGNGTYEFVNSETRYNLEFSFKVKKRGFRATANRKGLPIILQPRKKKHQRKPECASCHNQGFRRGYRRASKRDQQTISKLQTENQRLRYMLNQYRQSSNYQPTQTSPPVDAINSIAPSQTASMYNQGPVSNIKRKKKMKKEKCPNCNYPMRLDRDNNIYKCPKCKSEFKRYFACPNCEVEVPQNATWCSNCDEAIKAGVVERFYPICPKHKTRMKWSRRDGSFYCQECRNDSLLEIKKDEEDEEEFDEEDEGEFDEEDEGEFDEEDEEEFDEEDEEEFDEEDEGEFDEEDEEEFDED